MSQMLPQGVPPELLAALGAGQGGGQDQGGGGDNPLAVLQNVIHEVVSLIHALPSPQDTQDATKVLHMLTVIQSRLMGGNNGSPGPGS